MGFVQSEFLGWKQEKLFSGLTGRGLTMAVVVTPSGEDDNLE